MLLVRNTSIFFLGLLIFISAAFAFTVPSLTGPVVDQSGLLSKAAAESIGRMSQSASQQGLVQVQVLVLDSLDEPIEQVAIKTFDQWKLGDAKKDNGVLLLISKADRKVRIEVGQGLEGVIPDIIAKQMIRSIIQPLFKQNNFDYGTGLAVAAIISAAQTPDGQVFNVQNFVDQQMNGRDLQAPRGTENEGTSLKDNKKSKGGLFVVMGVLFLLWLLISLISPSTGLMILYMVLNSGGRGGGGRGGSSWGGGGGSSSGGGASGDW